MNAQERITYFLILMAVDAFIGVAVWKGTGSLWLGSAALVLAASWKRL